jgi:hypothetical protein
MNNVLTQYIRKGQKFSSKRDSKTKEKKPVIIYKGKVVGVMTSKVIQIGKDIKVIGLGFSRYSQAKITKYNYNKIEMEICQKETRRFNINFGTNMALKRCESYAYYNSTIINPYPKFCEKIPTYVKRQFIKFARRSEKYFQGVELPDWFVYFEDSNLIPLIEEIEERKNGNPN